MAISRHRPSQAPIVAGVATGAAARSNSRRSGASPRRCRAWHNAEGVGTCQCRSHAADEPQPADHLAHHFFVGLAEKQRQGDHVIDDQPGRQQAVTLFLAPRFGDHLIDQVTSINAGHHAQAQIIRQPARPWLLSCFITGHGCGN